MNQLLKLPTPFSTRMFITYSALQLCKSLRPNTWKTQIQKWTNSPTPTNNQGIFGFYQLLSTHAHHSSPVLHYYHYHPDFMALKQVNSLIYLNINDVSLSELQRYDLIWHYLQLLQRWLKKHSDSKLTKHIALKQQARQEAVAKMAALALDSNPEKSLLVQILVENTTPTQAIGIEEMINLIWLRTNQLLKQLTDKLKPQPIQVTFIKRFFINNGQTNLMTLLHLNHIDDNGQSSFLSYLKDAHLDQFNIKHRIISAPQLESILSPYDLAFLHGLQQPDLAASNKSNQLKNNKIKLQFIQTLQELLRLEDDLMMTPKFELPELKRHKKHFFSSSFSQNAE